MLPIEFTERMKKLLGQEFGEFSHSYQKETVRALRLNSLKKGISSVSIPKILREIGVSEADEPISMVPWASDAYYYRDTSHPGRHPYHEMGLYYIQEPSAMAPAELLCPRPGERVLDLCAAPGGKSTQIAVAMDQSGILVCNEIHPERARVLSRNIERMGISNAIVVNEDSGTLAECFGRYFHRILVDAPCSGEGMFHRHPETAGEWSVENILHCAVRQKEILENAARMLLPGGRIVYSTCTFAPEEDEGTIARFLIMPAKLEFKELYSDSL